MNPFDILSDDKIYEICEKLDDKSLSNLLESYSRIYSICLPVIKERKQTQINNFLNQVLTFVQNKSDWIKFFQYLRNNKKLIELIYEVGDKSEFKDFISLIIDRWKKLRYTNNILEIEQFRPFITELNKKYNINKNLYRYSTPKRFTII